jgi:dephospho-CoA kinase
MLKIGLTGGIGSGKSAVAAIFNVLGTPVFDADREAKVLMETNEELALSIKNLFGKDSYLEGKLNRPYVANIVFNDPFRLEQLNALVHPATISAANNWMHKQIAPYIIKEAALLFEAGTVANLNYIIGVYAPEHIRILRTMERDNATREQTLARMSRQINEEIKMKLCDFILVNDEKQLLIPQVLRLHEKFMQMKS